MLNSSPVSGNGNDPRAASMPTRPMRRLRASRAAGGNDDRTPAPLRLVDNTPISQMPKKLDPTGRLVTDWESVRRSRKRRRVDLDAQGGFEVMQEAVSRFPGKVHRQVSHFLQTYEIPSAIGRPRGVSFKTTTAYEVTIRSLLETLHELNIHPQNITEVTQRHVRMVIQRWEGQGMTYNAITNRWSHLKRLLGWIGKPLQRAVDRELNPILLKPPQTVVDRTAKMPRTPEAAGVNIFEVLERVRLEDERVHAQLLLITAFGLRVLEALSLRPIDADHGTHFDLVRGTKGGRHRSMPIDTVFKREAYNHAKRVAAANGDWLCDTRLSLEQNRTRYQTVINKHGITKKGLGFTSHGIRHSFAIREYEEAAGTRAPVNGGFHTPGADERGARQLVALRLGHSRPGITSAYIGNAAKMAQHCRDNLETWAKLVEADAPLRAAWSLHTTQALVTQDTLSLHLVGTPARGMPMHPKQMAFFVLEQTPAPDRQPIEQHAPQGGEVLSIETQRALRRHNWFKAAADLQPILQRLFEVPVQVVSRAHWNAMDHAEGEDETFEFLIPQSQ